MNLKELLEADFGKKFPISGGSGNSIENALVIHNQDVSDYVGLEYYILSCLGTGRKIEWRRLGQQLVESNGRKIDKIKIETKKVTRTEVITQIENYYFDISEFFEAESARELVFDEKETLLKIKNRMEELATINDFNKQCVDLLRENKLFEDNNDLLFKFLDVILEDESITLFDSMMKHKKQPILSVLRTIGEEWK